MSDLIQDTINTVKDELYKKLSYTSQSYEEILLDIISLFRDEDKLNTKWNNISEADIMFIFMSILAAHKDILNYMLDYRILESYMSTAKEDQSIKRIANSLGFKIPSYKAGRTKVLVSTGSITLSKFQSLLDNSGNYWTYIGEGTTYNVGDEIELYQGNKLVIDNIEPTNFTTNSTRTHKVSNKAIAIGNSYNSLGCSLLYASNGVPSEDIVFTEIDNIYMYDYSDRVYELFVDTIGETCIKLPYNIDMSEFSGYKFYFKGIITGGSYIDVADSFGSSSAGYILDPIPGEFYIGQNPPSKAVVKDLFKKYYNSSNSLVTLDEYKNYILNIQKIIPGISKCLIADNQHDTAGGLGSESGDPLHIGVYILGEYNATDNIFDLTSTELPITEPALPELGDRYIDPATSTLYTYNGATWDSIADVPSVEPAGIGLASIWYTYEEPDDFATLYGVSLSSSSEALLNDIQSKSMSGITVHINEVDDSLDQLTPVNVTIEINGYVDIEIKSIIIDYINSVDIGGSFSEKEISDALSANGYNYYSKVTITSPAPIDGELRLAFNEYATISETDITGV